MVAFLYIKHSNQTADAKRFSEVDLSGRDEGMEIEDVKGNTILLLFESLPELPAVAFYTTGESL